MAVNEEELEKQQEGDDSLVDFDEVKR